MSTTMDRLAKELKAMMTASDDRKPKPYDTQAEVLRVEDGVAWVHIPGGVQETPVRLTMDAKKGDIVNVHVAGGSAWITGNSTSPPTDDTVANQAQDTASKAMTIGEMAMDDATRARVAADIAEAEAERANLAADDAQEAADKSLTQLSIIEDVSGTLNWISKHGTYTQTTDTTVQEGIIYFTYNSMIHDYEPVINPSGNPSAQGWYILNISDSQSEYIMSHLALTSRGLWVLPSGMGTATDAQYAPNYKALLSNNGFTIFDSNGIEVAFYGAHARIGAIKTAGSYLEIQPNKTTLFGAKTDSIDFKQIICFGNLHGAQDTDLFLGDGETTSFQLSTYFDTVEEIPSDFSVYIEESLQTINVDYTIQVGRPTYVVFVNAPENGLTIEVNYTPNVVCPYFTFGTRKDNSLVKAYSFVSGKNCEASGNFSHAEGYETEAISYSAHAEGSSTIASGGQAHAEGAYTTASNFQSHAEGYRTIASNRASHAEGAYTTASGNLSHAEGGNTTASGSQSHAEGTNTTASNNSAHAEGYDTTASGSNSHAEGRNTTASGSTAHAEGYNTTSSSSASHAEGHTTEASGLQAHAEGSNTIASGDASHAQNFGTIAESLAQTAIGKYNIADSNNEYAFIIGNGSSAHRSNALSITWDGNINMALDSYQTAGNVDKAIYDNLVLLGWDSDVLI